MAIATFTSSFSYVTTSILIAVVIIMHAMITREQYFAAMLYLSTSKISVLAICNVTFAIALALAKMIKGIFLGDLRDSEVERLNDRTRENVMETCLAMTIFREEFNFRFLAMFCALLFLKAFHGLCKDRAEHMETAPRVRFIDRVRILTFMVVLLFVDVAFVKFAIEKVVSKGPSVVLLFGFEHVILASKTCVGMAKYFVALVDRFMGGNWQGKGAFVFYLELCADLVHLCVYVAFFSIIFAYYGLPIHLLRDVYVTFRQFKDRVAAFLRYRRVTANLDSRFPDANAQDLDQEHGGEDTCVVCREKMKAHEGSQTPIAKQMRAKKLPCSHAFHLHCLRSWLERQQACPTCRASVLPESERELERRQREREEGQWQRLPPELQPGYIAPEVQARLDAQTEAARRQREAAAAAAAARGGTTTTAAAPSPLGTSSAETSNNTNNNNNINNNSTGGQTAEEVAAEAERVRSERAVSQLQQVLSDHLDRRMEASSQQRATASTSSATAAATPTPTPTARTPPAPRFVQNTEQQQQQMTHAPVAQVVATPPPAMATPVAPSPSANLNPGREWWTPGTAAINASYQAGITMNNMDDSSLSEEDISARRMAHAAAAAVAAAAQQAQMAYMSIAPLGLLPPSAGSYSPFSLESQLQQQQQQHVQMNMSLTPEQYEKEYNRRKKEQHDMLSNEKIDALEKKIESLMKKLEEKTTASSLESKFTSSSSMSPEPEQKVLFRHANRTPSSNSMSEGKPSSPQQPQKTRLVDNEIEEPSSSQSDVDDEEKEVGLVEKEKNEEIAVVVEEEDASAATAIPLRVEEEPVPEENEMQKILRLRREKWLAAQPK